MEAFREARLRRTWRQALTVARAIRAGRARIRAEAPRRRIDGVALRDLLAEVAADARLVDVRVSRPPWTASRELRPGGAGLRSKAEVRERALADQVIDEPGHLAAADVKHAGALSAHLPDLQSTGLATRAEVDEYEYALVV
jgi:hypothetical protein